MLYFATSNKHKFKEAKAMLADRGTGIQHFPFQHVEIRSDSVEEIAQHAVRAAYAQLGKPVFVEDTGLFIPALNSFPGTYSAWVLRKIGCKGILKLLRGKRRSAYFQACIALATKRGVKTFTARCYGNIAAKERGKGGFGFDPIFIPRGYKQTFAESITLKNKLSHRYKSLVILSRYLKKFHIRL